MTRVCILDYGSGNVRSVFNLFSSVVEQSMVSNDPDDIRSATHVVLPGVGAFGAAMRKIGERLPLDVLEDAVLSKGKPFLGICVGMQVLATRGLEFGDFAGLGWIQGTVERVQSHDLPLPHIGWNDLVYKRASPLLAGLGENPDFYFVHSYAIRPVNQSEVLATASYGEEFCSVIARDNIFGVQFHPEKSQRAGLKLIRNFLATE